jgi:uncharacterized protein (TIGR03437 family)
VQGFAGDDGPAVNAKLSFPWGVAVDKAGDVFILDTFNYRVRKVSKTGIITTLAQVDAWALAADGDGNVFVTAPGAAIARIPPNGAMSSVAGTGGWSLAVDTEGSLFVADGNATVRKVSPGGAMTIVAGNGTWGYSGDGGPATNAEFANPSGVAVDGEGNLFITDRVSYRVRKVSANGGVTTVAGNGTGHFFADCSASWYRAADGGDGPARSAQLAYPLGVAVGRDGSVFIADTTGHQVRKVSADGTITTLAGTGTCGFSGDGGSATKAQLNWPTAVTVDGSGNVYIGDFSNQRIRKVSAGGIISTVAGTGVAGFSGDGGPATDARLRLDCDNTVCGGIAVDSRGNLFIADTGNNRIRRISPDGTIATVAGTGVMGFAGDGGPAVNAQISIPRGLAVDAGDNLYIAEDGGIRKVAPDGTITTIAGGPLPYPVRGPSGDDGPATKARLGWPVGVAADRAGNLFIADPGFNFETGDAGDDPAVDHRIRRISPDGTISTVAGNGSHDFTGDGGAAVTAALNGPMGVAVAADGNVYIADSLNREVRVLRPVNSPLLISSVVDAASQRRDAISPGKIVVIYGAGLGPSQVISNQEKAGSIGTELSGTTVSFNDIPAPILYASATQVAAVAPYRISGSIERVTVTYQGHTSPEFLVAMANTAPSIFTFNQAGWGQATAINVENGTANSPVNPIKVGGYLTLYATGGGPTTPAGVDGKIADSSAVVPALPVNVTVGGISAPVQYAGAAPGQVAGLMQVNIRIPDGVDPGGYVPVVLQVGDRSSGSSVWISISAK